MRRPDAAVRLACLIVFVVAVVATPPRAVWAFGLDLALLVGLILIVRLPVGVLARRLVIEVPFVLFALALPFVAIGPRRDLLGLSLSIEGTWAAWAILAKATLGTIATVILGWTTPVADLLAGMDRLRVPWTLTAICGFMVRYLDVVSGELHRLQIARVSRGDDPRWLWQARAVATTAGAVFVRSFERGERVQMAMVSRGFDGRFPSSSNGGAPWHWWPLSVWPGSAAVIAVVANLVVS